MKITNVISSLSKLTGRTGLVVQKNSPEILLVVGVVGTIASTVLACRATLKVESVLDAHKEKTDKINECWDKVQNGEISTGEYSQNDHKKDLTIMYGKTSLEFIKLYGPAFTLGVASIACIIGAHGIMKTRNVALMAAYKAVEESFTAYRKRVIEEHGEDVDYMYKNGLRSEVVTETEVDADGKSHKVKKTNVVQDPGMPSMYARFYDESCARWSPNAEYNLMFLRSQQNYHNEMLKVRGHVFLNEVYDALGIDRTKPGSVVGWVLGDGDNYIDFGIFDGNRERARAFVNGQERNILLDFNVDGVINDLI